MKKSVALIIITLLFIHVNLTAQWGWHQLNSGVNTNLNSVYFISSTGWAVGSSGLILKSTNSGQNWFIQSSGTTAELKCINFRNSPYVSGLGCIAGANGKVFVTIDKGETWLAVNTGVSNTLNAAIVLNDTMTIIAVGENGTIIKSIDMGQTWFQKPSPTTVTLKGIAQSWGNNLCAVGQGGVVLTSFDLGEYWSLETSGTSNDLNSVVQYSNSFSNLMAAGSNGTILKSSDAGFNWQPVTSGTTQNLLSIGTSGFDWYTTNLFYICISGSNGTILMSLDSGRTWQSNYSPINQSLNSIFFENNNTGYCAGNNGTILKTISNHYYVDRKTIDANTIRTWFTNAGISNYNINSSSPGFEWPKSTGHFARFGSGLWLGALVNNDTLVATLQYEENEYYPGYTDNSGVPHGRNDSNYRIYKLTYSQNDNDRSRWPNALLGNSNQGAPVYYDTLSNIWKPLDFGSQTMYYTYTDAYPESHVNYFGGQSAPLKADVKQLNFALDVTGPMGNVIITQYTIINRSSNIWNNAYFTIWTDDDIGNQWNDKVGCDSALQLGYSYNYGSDTAYSSNPPAVGFLLLKGAVINTGIITDTVKVCKNKNVLNLTGYKDLGMNSFNFSANGDINYPDANYYGEAYNLMKGVRVNGTPHYNPYGGFQTKYIYSGNPVTSTGWIQPTATDVRFYVSSGPVNMNPGDTQTIVTAQVIARGSNFLNSITLLKEYCIAVKEYYKSCYTSVPIGINPMNEIAYSFSLQQNYPNPFNPKTKIKFSIPQFPINKGLQPPVQIKIYDILGREISTIVNEQLKPGTYEVEFDGSEIPSGVYFYKLSSGGFTKTMKMVLVK